jgi:DNA-binding transcriptional ArsR family regulator
LASNARISRQGVTKHLRVLEDAGLIYSFRSGRSRHWQIRAEQIALMRSFLDSVSAEWDDRIERLRSLVESGSGE